MSQSTFDKKEFDHPLDAGIAYGVKLLMAFGIETYESCEGGDGHSYPEPAIRFHGDRSEGFKALAIALQHDLPVECLRRVWSVQYGEPVGPTWELVFFKKIPDYSEENPATASTPPPSTDDFRTF